jgi:hypothetical protein
VIVESGFLPGFIPLFAGGVPTIPVFIEDQGENSDTIEIDAELEFNAGMNASRNVA